jgi:NTP pyrophosphatase (non-canonical NTP hydrolase)
MSMNLNDYQSGALTTAKYPRDFAVIYPALGLNGEAGEVADKVKKVIRDNVIMRNTKGEIIIPNDKLDAIKLELGDVLWYIATLAHDLGFTLEDVAKSNLEKLASRAERGTIGGSGDFR